MCWTPYVSGVGRVRCCEPCVSLVLNIRQTWFCLVWSISCNCIPTPIGGLAPGTGSPFFHTTVAPALRGQPSSPHALGPGSLKGRGMLLTMPVTFANREVIWRLGWKGMLMLAIFPIWNTQVGEAAVHPVILMFLTSTFALLPQSFIFTADTSVKTATIKKINLNKNILQ